MWETLRKRKLYFGIVAAVALMAGFAIPFLPADRLPSDRGDPASRRGAGYTLMGSADATSGTELIAIYFGSANCAWSNRDSMPQAVREVKTALAEKADARGHAFASVGVALDWSVEEGLDHLDRFGHFDEVSTGRNWLNSAAVDYVWKDVPGRPATPQILVLKRTVRGPGLGSSGGRYVVDDPNVVVRKVGYHEILRWVDEDVALPRDEDGRIVAVGGDE